MGSEKKKRRRDSEKGTDSSRKKTKARPVGDVEMGEETTADTSAAVVYVSPIAQRK